MKFQDLTFTKNDMGGWYSRTDLGNNIQLSVVAGEFPYSTPRENLSDPYSYSKYEIAIFRDGEFTKDFFDPDHNDDVMGWVDKTEIESIIKKILES